MMADRCFAGALPGGTLAERCLTLCRYSLAIYSVDTASNVQRAGPFTVVVGAGVFSASAPAPSSSSAAYLDDCMVTKMLMSSAVIAMVFGL